MGELVSIVYKPQAAVPAADGYTRVPLREARLVAGYGIDGDAKGGSTTRQLNIMAAEAIQALATEGFCAAPGQLGEQLTLVGIEVDTLPEGIRLQIGEKACVELREPRTGCGKLERYQGKPREAAAGRLGRMAQVVVDGVIRIGDPVRVAGGSGVLEE
jgi:MOSC domain-containing protein YiiM